MALVGRFDDISEDGIAQLADVVVRCFELPLIEKHLDPGRLGAFAAALGAALATAAIGSFVAGTLASINIFGGFLVTRRMLAMFRKDA